MPALSQQPVSISTEADQFSLRLLPDRCAHSKVRWKVQQTVEQHLGRARLQHIPVREEWCGRMWPFVWTSFVLATSLNLYTLPERTLTLHIGKDDLLVTKASCSGDVIADVMLLTHSMSTRLREIDRRAQEWRCLVRSASQ